MFDRYFSRARTWLSQPALNRSDVSQVMTGFAMVVAGAILPFVVGAYQLTVIRDALELAILALSYDLLWGACRSSDAGPHDLLRHWSIRLRRDYCPVWADAVRRISRWPCLCCRRSGRSRLLLAVCRGEAAFLCHSQYGSVDYRAAACNKLAVGDRWRHGLAGYSGTVLPACGAHTRFERPGRVLVRRRDNPRCASGCGVAALSEPIREGARGDLDERMARAGVRISHVLASSVDVRGLGGVGRGGGLLDGSNRRRCCARCVFTGIGHRSHPLGRHRRTWLAGRSRARRCRPDATQAWCVQYEHTVVAAYSRCSFSRVRALPAERCASGGHAQGTASIHWNIA